MINVTECRSIGDADSHKNNNYNLNYTVTTAHIFEQSYPSYGATSSIN